MANANSPDFVEGPLAFAWRRWRLQRRFRRKVGYWGEFETPVTHEEKVQFRKLYGNHHRYALMADKYRVRQYVAERVGARYLVPLLGVYDRLAPEVFGSLPEQFMIKANHGCKWHRIVWNKAELDIPSTVRYFNRLMHKHYGHKSGEYHYCLIEPKILIETLLVDGSDSPVDYNLYCYHSNDGFDYAIAIATPRAETVVHFDKHWNRVEGQFTAEQSAKHVNPKNFDEMVHVAEVLSRGFDFIRIDLYNVNGQIYFGEATCTPAAGFEPLEDPVRARMRAEMWKLDVDNPQLYRSPKAA
jgi:hypothetical protein